MEPNPEDFERLGAFYLGRVVDADTGTTTTAPLLYDSRDLTTHGVCVGMTGSGKTGLCISLLEEAAIDGIPAIVLDPKGDLANLALLFPELLPANFEPWVSDDEAARRGISKPELANDQAQLWSEGLAKWGQDGARIRRLLDACEVRLYTPGSTAGEPISVIASFDAPPPELVADLELFAERIDTSVRGLLGLAGLGSGGDMPGREHTLLAAILQSAWQSGESLSLIELVRRIQRPPFESVGVLDLETFYPEKDRFQLVLAFNNLLASTAFAVWGQGTPLDIQSLLYTAEGKPRLAILSIAHLGENERMFFVSLLLNALVSWMRSQSGTTSLRALFYMDEVFGYFPPTANPPSKKPLLTLFKQARAYGLGVLLATQNPADLDYKGLANAGTWFIGRLQTERDKMRLIDGLVGAAAGFDRAALDAALARLGKRVFLMKNVHDASPTLFETRWAMSYLAGPLTRDQIRTLALRQGKPREEPAKAVAPVSPPPTASPLETSAPIIKGIRQVYLDTPRANTGLDWIPRLLVLASVRYRQVKLKVDETRDEAWSVPFADSLDGVDWTQAVQVDEKLIRLDAPTGIGFEPVPAAATRTASFKTWARDSATWFIGNHSLEVWRCDRAGIASEPGEDEAAFRIRLGHRYREIRDERAAKLREVFAKRLAALDTKIDRAREAVQRGEARAGQERMQTMVSIGSGVLGALFGRRAISSTTIGKATTAARGLGRSAKASGDVAAAREKLADLTAEREALNGEFHSELTALTTELDAMASQLEKVDVPAIKTGTRVRETLILWASE